ncbi:class I adenylate-forming enzyme family protein [Pradoshia sp.]
MNIVELLESTASRLPNQPVIHFRGTTINYKELLDSVYAFAAGLKEQGVEKGTRVALMMTNRPEYIISYFAILANGGTVVPINPTFKEKETTYIINDSESELLIMEELTRPVIESAKRQFQYIREIFYYGTEEDVPFPRWQGLRSPSPITNAVPLPADTVAQIIYTSGTTGHPKGAMITHDNLNWMSITAAVTNQLSSTDRVLCVLPLFHAYAKLQGILSPIAHGAAIYLEERFHPVDTLEKLANEKITVFLGVPTMYALFLRNPKINEFDFSHLRIAGCGGASLPAEILQKTNRSLGVDIGEGYGLTESTVMLMTTPRDLPKKIKSVGMPIPGVELKIVDPEGKETAPHQVGEIIFRGPNMMKGYYKQPEETEHTIKGGWLYTGDLAYHDEEGYHFIVDRKKDTIIRGGFNIYPRELEEVLYEHPGILECSVIGRPDEVFGEKTVAYINKKSPELTEDEVRAYCAGKMAEYKVPDYICFIDEIPKSGTGKILKTVLKEHDRKAIQS